MSSPTPLIDTFEHLLYSWNAEQGPRLKYLAGPVYLSEWVDGMRQAMKDFTDALEKLPLTTDASQQQVFLTYLTTKLESLLPLLAELPTAAPTNLRQAVENKRKPAFLHTIFYDQVTAALAVAGKGPATPPYDEDEKATVLFQHEHSQAAYLAVWRLLQQHLVALTASANTPKSPRSKPAILWKAGPRHLLELLYKLQEQGHLLIQETDVRKLSQAVTGLFALEHDEPVRSADWVIFKTYLTDKEVDPKTPNKPETKTHNRRPKNPLYDGIEPYRK